MFKRLSSTISTKKNTKAEATEAPAKVEPVPAVVEAKEPVSSEIRAEDAPRDIIQSSDAIQAMDNVISKAEETACANEAVRGAMAYALAQGQEGDAIDQVFNKVEGLTCAPEDEASVAVAGNIKLCAITKFSKDERVGIALRTSLSVTDGLYVNAITAGSKFEATELAVGQKLLGINEAACPPKLSDAIALLKNAESALVLTVGPNDEAAKKIEEMGQLVVVEPAAEVNDLVVKKAEMTEIAVDGYADSCGFFWSLQNGLCALQETSGGAKAIEAQPPQPVAEEAAPKEEQEEEKKEADAPKEEEEEDKEAAAKKESEEEEAKPEIAEKALADEGEEASTPKQDKKKKSLFKIKAPSLPSIKLGKSKNKKASEEEVQEEKEEVPPSPVDTVTGENGLTTIKFTKDTVDESVGLALRNSVLNDNIYVYGIFEGSKLKTSGLTENMRIHSINGEIFSNVEEAVKVVKESATLEIVAGPNDEPEAEEEEEEEEEPVQSSGGWFW